MTMHQMSKACRAVGSKAQPELSPSVVVDQDDELDGEHQTEVDVAGTGPDCLTAETMGQDLQPTGIEIMDTAEAVNVDRTSQDVLADPWELMGRACRRLDAIEADIDVAARTWRGVGMVDEHGFRLTEAADDQSDGGEATMDEAGEDERAHQAVLRTLVDLMAPSDGSLGLTAAQRKRLFEFANACLSHGQSDATITDILRTATTNSGKSSSSERLLEVYLDSLCSGDGWTERVFSVVTGHTATTRWNTNIISDLVELVQDPTLFPFMRMKPEYDGKNFDHPATGLHMYAFHELIKKQRMEARDWDASRDVILLLVFFSDATLLANKGSLSAHPVVLSIANLPPILATRNQLLLGFLSKFDKTQKDGDPQDKRRYNAKQHAELKRAMMAKQTAAMVSPLVRASYEGVPFISPTDGRQMRMFPTLFCAPLDHPEVCSHLGVKSSYCGICKWKTGNYSGERDRAPFRNEADSINFVDIVSKAPSSDIDTLKGTQGAHGQRSGLWGFNGSAPVHAIPSDLMDKTKRAIRKVGSSTPWTDLHLVVAGEVMHEIDLGLLVYARKAVLNHLQVTLGKNDQSIEDINEALRLSMTYESRWPGLRYPPTKKDTSVLQGYYGGTSRVEAGEHRSVLQFAVPILVRFLGTKDPAVRLMASVIEYYRARQVHLVDAQPGLRTHTKESLRRVDKIFDQMKSLLEGFEYRSVSEDETPKMHQQSHFRLQVMRLGTTSITTGQAGEANNAKIKSSVTGKRTNMQKASVERTIVKLHRRSRMNAQMSRRTLALPASSKRYKTSEILAAQSDFCVFSSQRNVRKNNRFTTSDINHWITNHIGSLARSREMAKYDGTTDVRRDLFNFAPVDSHKDQDTPMNQRLALIFGDWTVGQAFLNELSFFLTGTNSKEGYDGETFCFTLKIVHTASNPSVLAQSSRNATDVRMLQRLRADPSFRGTARKQYDFVALTADSSHKGEDIWYARLVLLFHIKDPKEKGKWQQLAFVRYLSRQENYQDEVRRLSKKAEPRVAPLTYSHRQRNNKTVWYYGVCSVESILRRVHVVASNEEGSVSLRYSRGDRPYFEIDRKARFLLNYNIFDSTTEPYFRPSRPPSRESGRESGGEQ